MRIPSGPGKGCFPPKRPDICQQPNPARPSQQFTGCKNGADHICAGKHKDRRRKWALQVEHRRGRNIADVSLATKNARNAWALLARDVDFHSSGLPQAA